MTEYVTAADGTRIAFERAGAGPALLLLHCMGCNRTYWSESGYLDALSAYFTVASVDTRGFGESDAPSEPAAYAEERILADVLAVADALGVERFNVWGHSYGAVIARELAATSDRVSHAVMVGNHFGAIFPPQRLAQARADLEPLARAQASDDPATALAELGIGQEEREEMLRFPARTTLLNIESLSQWPLTQPADLRCPTLVVTGSRDARVLAALESQRADIAAAGIIVVTLPDLDHGQLVTERATVMPAVLPFLMA